MFFSSLSSPCASPDHRNDKIGSFKDRDLMRQMPEPGKGKSHDTTVASDDGLYTIQYTESESNDDITEGHMDDSKMIVMEHLYVQVSLRLDVFCKVSEGGLYECLHCPDVCPSIEEFKKHYKDKHLETFYDCTKCGFSTLCQGTMSDHVSRYHDNDASLVKRKLIRKVSAGTDEYQTSVHGSFMSQSNKTKTPTSNSSQADKVENVSPKTEMVRRPLERTKENELDSDIDKMDHDESDGSDSEGRNNESRHECKVCLQKFTRSERVREHYDAIHLNMVYICCICGYTNRWKRSVIQHLRSKHEKCPPYKHLMIKKRVDSIDVNNKQPNFANLQSQTQRTDDSTPNLSPFHDEDEEEDELREQKMIQMEEQHFDSDLHDEMEDLEADDYDEGLDAGSEHELDLSRNSMTHPNKHLYNKSKPRPTDFSMNNQSQTPYETLWACRICPFSHKLPLIMTNHMMLFHKLAPPYDQYIKEIKGPSVSQMLDIFQSKPFMPSNNHKGGYLKEILDLSTSQFNRNNDKNSGSPFGFNLSSFAKSSPLTPAPVMQNYLCKLCDKSFDTLRGLKEHTEGMHTDLVWACKLCPFTDKWRPQAISHLRNSHNCQPPYNDHLSRRSANSSSSNVNHISRPQSSEDSGSHLDLPSTSNSFSEHSTFDLPTGLRHCKEPKMNSKECYTKLANDQYQCTKCNKTCGSAQGITEHYEAFHLGMLYYCQLCDFTDVWRSMMTKHLRQKHQLGKPYDEYLKRVKLDPNSKQITDSSMMDSFRRRSNPIKNSQLSPEGGPPLPHVIVPHVKSLISQPSASSNGSSHAKTPKTPISNGRSLIAAPSNGSIPTGGVLNLESKGMPKLQSSHKQDSSMGKQYIHLDNQLKCKLCGSVFTSLQGFQEHYEAIHLDVIWTCRKCPTSFRWRQQLTKHLKLIHECEPPFNEYMLKEAGSHKLKKPIPEKSPHGAYARRSILPKESESNDYKQSSMEDDQELSLPVIKDQESTINNESHDLAIPEDLSMSDKASFSSTTTTTTTTPTTNTLNATNNIINPVTTPSVMKNYTYLNNQFLCKLCSANFTSLQGFQEHYEAVHLNIVFVCKLCGFVNRWRPQVTSHLKRNHAVDPPYADYLIKRPSNKLDVEGKMDDDVKMDDMEIDDIDQDLDIDHEVDLDDFDGASSGQMMMAHHQNGSEHDPEMQTETMHEMIKKEHAFNVNNLSNHNSDHGKENDNDNDNDNETENSQNKSSSNMINANLSHHDEEEKNNEHNQNNDDNDDDDDLVEAANDEDLNDDEEIESDDV